MTTMDAREGALDSILTAREQRTSPAVREARKALRDAAPGAQRPCQQPGMEAYWDAVDTDQSEHLWPELAYDRIGYAADQCLDCPVFLLCDELRRVVLADTSRKRKPAITGVLAGRLVGLSALDQQIDETLATGVPFGQVADLSSRGSRYAATEFGAEEKVS